MKKKAVNVSVYFNLIHKGHIECINYAKAIGELFVVIVNSDYPRALKMVERISK